MTDEMETTKETKEIRVKNLAETQYDPVYSMKLRLLIKAGVDEAGDDLFEYIEHKVKIPRFGTDGMLNYQEIINKKFGLIALEKDEKKRSRKLLEAGLTEGWAARKVIEIIVGLEFLKILHPRDYDKLKKKILEMEKEVMDPRIAKMMEEVIEKIDSQETPSDS